MMEWRNSAERGVGRDRRSKVEGGWLGTYGTAVGRQAEPDGWGAVQVSTYERCRWRRRQGKLDKTFPGTTHNSPINSGRFYYTWDWPYYARFRCLDFLNSSDAWQLVPSLSPLLCYTPNKTPLDFCKGEERRAGGEKLWESRWTKQHRSWAVGLWGPYRQDS